MESVTFKIYQREGDVDIVYEEVIDDKENKTLVVCKTVDDKDVRNYINHLIMELAIDANDYKINNNINKNGSSRTE